MDRVLLLTDSLALPREKPEKCMFEETWPSLLRKTEHEVHQVSIGGATSDQLLGQCNYHKCYKPDIVIVQVGIVDCAPRFVTLAEKNILQNIPFIGKKILALLNRNWIRRLRSTTYISKKSFESNIKGIINIFQSAKIYLIEIVGGEEYDMVLPNVHDHIGSYNDILMEIEGAEFISFYEKGMIMDDYHHLNYHGHKVLYEVLEKKIFNGASSF